MTYAHTINDILPEILARYGASSVRTRQTIARAYGEVMRTERERLEGSRMPTDTTMARQFAIACASAQNLHANGVRIPSDIRATIEYTFPEVYSILIVDHWTQNTLEQFLGMNRIHALRDAYASFELWREHDDDHNRVRTTITKDVRIRIQFVVAFDRLDDQTLIELLTGESISIDY